VIEIFTSISNINTLHYVGSIIW